MRVIAVTGMLVWRFADAGYIVAITDGFFLAGDVQARSRALDERRR